MGDTIQALHAKMEEAAQALDFEEARRLRDKIQLMRGGATATEAKEADGVALDRQRPGAMGLGTSQGRIEPPADWKRPVKPDPMTTGHSRRR